MKVYLVNEWNDYYPGSDNTIAIFRDLADAEEWLLEYLKDRRCRADRYEIFKKEVTE